MARIRKAFTDLEKTEICFLWNIGYGAKEICSIVKSLNSRKPQTLYPVLMKAGLYTKKPADDRRRFQVDDTYFDNIDNEHKAYWLGFMLADGFLSNSGHATESFGMTLRSDDKYILEQFLMDLNATYTVKEYSTTSSWGVTSVAKILIKSKRIFNRLRELGFTTNKSYDGTLPDIREDLVHHMVRGYFDGNGCLGKAGEKRWHTYTFNITGTYEIVSTIRSILGKDNVKLSQRHKDRDNNNYSLFLCGDRQVYNICKWMYDDATIYLKRKYERYLILQRKYISNTKQSSS